MRESSEVLQTYNTPTNNMPVRALSAAVVYRTTLAMTVAIVDIPALTSTAAIPPFCF